MIRNQLTMIYMKSMMIDFTSSHRIKPFIQLWKIFMNKIHLYLYINICEITSIKSCIFYQNLSNKWVFGCGGVGDKEQERVYTENSSIRKCGKEIKIWWGDPYDPKAKTSRQNIKEIIKDIGKDSFQQDLTKTFIEEGLHPNQTEGGANGPPGFENLISPEPKVGLTSNQAVNLSLSVVQRPM